ncbi:MAG TPA: hypothetical protein VF533_09670 [Solirubrobacteraceae bacterium]|jgi:hypothetical protein
MPGLLLGAAAAVLASMLFSLGLVLQSVEARTIPAGRAARASSFLLLLRNRRWVLGGLAMVVGFGFHISALLVAPLTVVQPALAAGLVVLLVAGARREQAPITTRDMVAVAAIGAGVLGLTLTSSDREAVEASGALIGLVLVPLAAMAVLPRLLAVVESREISLPATLGAGAAYALTGLTTKLASDRLEAGDAAGAALWLAITAAAAALALVDQTIALQGRGATEVGVVIYVAPVLVPVLVAIGLLGEGPASAAGAAGLAVSVLAVCAGAGTLATSRQVSGASAPAPA